MKNPKLTRQTMFLTLGYPGAGKTHTARQLAEVLGIARVSADRIRYDLFEHPTYSRDEDAIVFRVFDYMLEEILKSGQSVICDGDFSLRKSRRLKYELAKKHGVRSVLLYIQTDIDTAYGRSINRDGRRIDDKYSPSLAPETFDMLVRKLKEPLKEPVIVASGKHAFKVQLKNILLKLAKTGLITMEGPVKARQANPTHTRTLRGKSALKIDFNK